MQLIFLLVRRRQLLRASAPKTFALASQRVGKVPRSCVPAAAAGNAFQLVIEMANFRGKSFEFSGKYLFDVSETLVRPS